MATISVPPQQPSSARREYTPLEAALLDRTEAEVRARGALEAARRLVPRLNAYRREMDQEARIPRELLAELRDAGMLTLTLPVALGGLGLFQDQAYVPWYRILETLATGD